MRELAGAVVDLFTRWLTVMAILLGALGIYAVATATGLSENAAGAACVAWLIAATIAALVIRSRLSEPR